MHLRLRSLRIVALIVVVSLPLLGMSGVASAKAKGCHKTHSCKSGGGGKTGGSGGAPAPMTVQIDPDLVETASGGIVATIQVETSPSLAGDAVFISSSQLEATCAEVFYYTIEGTTGNNFNNEQNEISVILDDDGNATVLVGGLNCAPGTDVIEADLEAAPFYTAVGTLIAGPPVTTPSGVFGYPTTSGTVTTGEVETGDTAASGDSDVYAVFYVETDPVYAEQLVEISSAQLEASCITGWSWTEFSGNGTNVSGTGVNINAPATATLDDDGNAVFAFFGSSCAATTSEVIADVLAGTHQTYTTTFTVDPPQPT